MDDVHFAILLFWSSFCVEALSGACLGAPLSWVVRIEGFG